MDKTTATTACMQFIRTKTTAVLATVASDGAPTAATIYFAIDEDFTIYFQTKSFTRKYENLQQHRGAALVIGTEDEPVTVQIQGEVEQIVDANEYERRFEQIKEVLYKSDFVAPLFQLSSEHNHLVIYKLTPTWIRWLDLRGDKADGGFVQIR